MILLTDDEVDALRIEQLIFHVVQHEDQEPILLDETPIGPFEGFFLARVRDNLRGNNYEFLPGSATYQLLAEILQDPRKFVPNSKQLAINFHSVKNNRMKPGAIMLMRLCTGERDIFSLTKFDHEIVVAYNLVGNAHAVLEEIVNNFTASKKAIQKSALIELSDHGGQLVVIDNTVPYDITQYFRGFLNIRRIYSDAEMTNEVHEAILETAFAHKTELPKEVTETMRSNSFQAVQALESFDPEVFFGRVLGAHGSEKMFRTFLTNLKKRGIQGDTFRFDKQAIKPPKVHKYRTREGVRLSYGETAAENVKINYGTGNKLTTITIKTQQLIEE